MQEMAKKIRELRKAKQMTQEELALRLGVSAQAISKWETAQSAPDISLLIPLCHVLSIGVDELLGGSKKEELEQKFLKAVVKEESLLVSEEALLSFPDNETWLYRRACDEFFIGKQNSDERFLKRAEKHFRYLMRKYPDDKSYRRFLARTLAVLGNREQAMRYTDNNNFVLQEILEGDELIQHRQKALQDKFINFYNELLSYNTEDSLSLAESLIKLYFNQQDHDRLSWILYDKKAALCRKNGDTVGYVSNKREAYRLAQLADQVPSDTTYSSPLVNKLARCTPPISETEQFLAGSFRGDELHDLKCRIVRQNLSIQPLDNKAQIKYVEFFKDRAYADIPNLTDFSTDYDIDAEQRAEFNKQLAETAKSDLGILKFKIAHIKRAQQLISDGTLTGFLACLGHTVVGFCNCGDKTKYKWLGLTAEDRGEYTAPANARIFSIVDLVVDPDFACCGIEERLIDHACDSAHTASFEYVEAYISQDMSTPKRYHDLVNALQRCGFDIIRSIFSPMKTMRVTLQKKLTAQTIQPPPTSQMSVQEFGDYLNKGLGRAYTLLRQEPDKQPFWETLKAYLTTDRADHRKFGNYEKWLLKCFDNYEERVGEVCSILLEKLKEGSYDCTLQLLGQLGYDQARDEILEQNYKKSYLEFLEETKRFGQNDFDSQEQSALQWFDQFDDSRAINNYVTAFSALASVKKNDEKRMGQLLLDLASFYSYAKYPTIDGWLPTDCFPLEFESGKKLSALFDEMEQIDPNLKKFKHKFKFDIEREDLIKNITFDDIAAYNKARYYPTCTYVKEYKDLWNSFTSASPEVVREVAARAMYHTSDAMEQAFLLSFFWQLNNAFSRPPIFPSDMVDSLLEMQQKEIDQLKNDKSGTAFILPAHRTLVHVRDPRVKVLGKKLYTEKPTEDAALFGLYMYFDINYTVDDREYFANAMRHSFGTRKFNCFFDILRSNAFLGTPDMPYELLAEFYSQYTSPTDRFFAVQALIRRGLLPKELLDECKYDCSVSIRKLAKATADVNKAPTQEV